MTNNLNELALLLQKSCSSQQWQQFTAYQQQLKESHYALSNLQIILASLRRKVGSQSLSTSIDIDDGTVKHWKTDELARVYCILTTQYYHSHCADALLGQLYTQGDEYEREAILKGLWLLDPKGQKSTLAIDAARTNIVTLFSAIGQLNPYPARHFSQEAFNQLTLKTLFLGLDINFILGLKKRLNSSMSRMCFDYLRERIAANRAIPTSIWQAINLKQTPAAEAFFIQFLQNKNPQHHANILSSLNNQTVPDTILSVLTKSEKKHLQAIPR